MSLFLTEPHYYSKLSDRLQWPTLKTLRSQRFDEKVQSHTVFQRLQESVEAATLPVARDIDFSKSVVKIGDRSQLDVDQFDSVGSLLKEFSPWKKGPFSVFGHEIDSEWRSDWKWKRIMEHCPDLKGHVVADIGCSNGYFMFRMLQQQPEHVIGMDPFAKAYLKFELLRRMAGVSNIDYDLIGAEHAELFPECFDTVFCLGVVYHHTDPMQLLRSIYKSMKKGATLIIESQGIPGDLPVALCPRQRYARARGIWFLPTQSCLENWLGRAQFRDIECFYNEPLSIDEQRKTDWAQVDSLSDFLDPNDSNKTVEGYPAPVRIYFKARK